MAQLVVKADLEKRVGAPATLSRYSQQNDANITEAIEMASDLFRSAAIQKYTEESVDALVAATITKETKFYIVSLALGVLCAGGMGVPDEIPKKYEEARVWLSWLAAGKVHLDGLSKLSSSPEGTGGVSYSMPEENVFDLDNES